MSNPASEAVNSSTRQDTMKLLLFGEGGIDWERKAQLTDLEQYEIEMCVVKLKMKPKGQKRTANIYQSHKSPSEIIYHRWQT